MSGRPIHIDHRRRDFLKQLCGILFMGPALTALSACASRSSGISGGFYGAGEPRGHLLRKGQFPEPVREINCKVLIAGGGVSGLSARRHLFQKGVPDVLLLELEDHTGGNASGGANRVSPFPWAAHYLPIPDPESKELIQFLRESGVITSINEQGLPVYDEYALCHDPEERLFINGIWQEGLVPQYGLSKESLSEISRFFSLIGKLKGARGSDGKFAFAIPLDDSSVDESFRKLDRVSFAQYLTECGFRDHYLLWYLEYCCKDDYGSALSDTSAWAGLHYFASRRGLAANAPASAVLTWPEGNARLAEHLRKAAHSDIETGFLVYNVVETTTGVEVLAYDCVRCESVRILSDRLILATPQFVNKHLLGSRRSIEAGSYAPWLVANITLRKQPFSRGVPLSWDNVLYGQPSVGYVFANHQQLDRPGKCVFTYYLPIVGREPSEARAYLRDASFESLCDQIVAELNVAHPDIAAQIEYMEIRVWGHGMIRPVPGYIWGAERHALKAQLGRRIFFAHSDLSGISIFEEAFYQGLRAAQQVIDS